MTKAKKKPITTRKSLAEVISVQLQSSKKDALIYVDAVVDAMIQSLLDGSKIQINEFVNMEIKTKSAQPAKTGRNPRTGEAIQIAAKPESKVFKATPSRAFKKRIQ